MNRYSDTTRTMRLDPDSFASGYFQNAVYRHWDPYRDIPDELLEGDRERLVERDQRRNVQVDAPENHGAPIAYKLYTESAQS